MRGDCAATFEKQAIQAWSEKYIYAEFLSVVGSYAKTLD